MNKLHEILEVCLTELESGADIETVLFRYPEYAPDLRPILETAAKAKQVAVPAPTQDVLKRNKAKILQRAAELREARENNARRLWSVPLRRVTAGLIVTILLFASGTGLVSASTNSVPGDNLYPVKRSWENFTLFFAFDMVHREELELEYEHERLDELQELFTEGRSATVDFSGYVTRQSGNEWRISGVTIVISQQTLLSDDVILQGSAVHVIGTIDPGGFVVANSVELLPAGSVVPEVIDDELEGDKEDATDLNEVHETESSPSVESETEQSTPIKATSTPTDYEVQDESIEGITSYVNDDTIIVDGVELSIDNAEVSGTPVAGSKVKVEGYYDANGQFIVTHVEFEKPEDHSTEDTQEPHDEEDH